MGEVDFWKEIARGFATWLALPFLWVMTGVVLIFLTVLGVISLVVKFAGMLLRWSRGFLS